MHTHKCGFEPITSIWDYMHFLKVQSEGGDLAGGCGHEWQHERDSIIAGCGSGATDEQVSEAFRQAHTCPRCGKGPWYVIHQDDSGELHPCAVEEV